MTLYELAKMRRLRARPAYPVVLTDDARVHEFCAANDLPVLWIPGLADDADLAPLYGLPVWVIPTGQYGDLTERVREHKPESLWVTGFHGYARRIEDAIGRKIWTS